MLFNFISNQNLKKKKKLMSWMFLVDKYYSSEEFKLTYYSVENIF